MVTFHNKRVHKIEVEVTESGTEECQIICLLKIIGSRKIGAGWKLGVGNRKLELVNKEQQAFQKKKKLRAGRKISSLELGF